MDKQFCTACGQEMALEWSGHYNASDGSKRMVFLCPKKPCCGTCRGPFKRVSGFLGLLLNKVECQRCGTTDRGLN